MAKSRSTSDFAAYVIGKHVAENAISRDRCSFKDLYVKLNTSNDGYCINCLACEGACGNGVYQSFQPSQETSSANYLQQFLRLLTSGKRHMKLSGSLSLTVRLSPLPNDSAASPVTCKEVATAFIKAKKEWPVQVISQVSSGKYLGLCGLRDLSSA